MSFLLLLFVDTLYLKFLKSLHQQRTHGECSSSLAGSNHSYLFKKLHFYFSLFFFNRSALFYVRRTREKSRLALENTILLSGTQTKCPKHNVPTEHTAVRCFFSLALGFQFVQNQYLKENCSQF